MELIQLPGYDLEEKREIAKRFLIPKQRKECGLKDDQLTFTPAAVDALIEQYTRESGLRSLEKQIAAVARKIARGFAEGETKAKKVRAADLEKYLGPRKHDPEKPDDTDRVGLATGLAWTEAGGSILHVESTMMPGKAGLTLTGQLGSVMKESVQAALSCARSRALSYGIDPDLFGNREIHVHVPQGAIPKDGPSAGITMAASLVSLLTGLPIRREVAMTGEITLRGRVLPVGGLRQKLLAAARAGIREVIVPSPNGPDLTEIPQALLKKLQLHLVSDLDEVLRIALVGFETRDARRDKTEVGQPIGLA
jgi:ATP-dependent Lon protease